MTNRDVCKACTVEPPLLAALLLATPLLALVLVTACAGEREPDPPDAAPFPAEAPGATPAPTCDDWGTFVFFESASPRDVQTCLDAGADLHGPDDGFYGPPFHTAARLTRHPEVIALLVEAGADVDARDWNGSTPLHSAAAGNPRAGVVAALLDAGADPNARDLDEVTPLHMAAQSNENPEIVTALVEAGADPSARGPAGLTPLHMAWSDLRPPQAALVVRDLLRLGADGLARNDRGQVADPTHCEHWNTGWFARSAVRADFARCLEQGADVFARDANELYANDGGYTVLHHATANGDGSIIGLLVDAGAELEARNEAGYTPLHQAVSNSNPAAVTALVEAGADIEADAGGMWGTPLVSAALRIRGTSSNRNATTIAIIDALLAAGADVNAVDENGDTPLVKVLQWGQFGLNSANERLRGTDATADSVVALALKLLEAGADPDARGVRTTPLIEATEFRSPALVRALLDAGADPNRRANFGSSPLHAAANSGSLEVITLLVAAGAEVNSQNENGDTPLHMLATRVFDTALVTLLASAGADVNARNDTGETPLQAARNHANEPVARKLLDLGADPGVLEGTAGVDGPLCDLGDFMFLIGAPAESLSDCLAAGFPVNQPGRFDQTPLVHLAGSTGWGFDEPDKVAVLLAAGADVTARTRSGLTPLHLVAQAARDYDGHRKWAGSAGRAAAAALLDAGADVNAGDAAGERPLHKAVQLEDDSAVFMITLLIEAGADVNARTNDGQTPLHQAASLDRVTAMAALLEAGAEVDARTNNGRTPLHQARERGQPAAAAILLEAGADPVPRDQEGRLYDPVSCEHWGTRGFFAFATLNDVTVCLDAGADPRDPIPTEPPRAPSSPRPAYTPPPSPPLHTAVAHTRDPAVITALLQAGADVNARSEWDRTALHEAAEHGTLGVVRVLLEAGAEVDARPRRFDDFFRGSPTPLHLAARTPDPEVAAALLEAGADVDARGRQGETPLHNAAWNPNPAVAELLLEAGAEVNAPQSSGLTPLHRAVSGNSNPAVLDVLLEAGADVHARGSYNHSHAPTGTVAPLHSAAYWTVNPEIIAILVAAGANPNGGAASTNRRAAARPALPRSPLHLAASINPNPAVIEALVRAGADLELTDSDGRTILHRAAIGIPKAFPLLLRLGADPEALDAEGKTPMDYARENPALNPWERVRMSSPLGRR